MGDVASPGQAVPHIASSSPAFAAGHGRPETRTAPENEARERAASGTGRENGRREALAVDVSINPAQAASEESGARSD
ncbi:hypothetical protein VTN02DRAFT_2623 [Thermoascus thermophilus]